MSETQITKRSLQETFDYVVNHLRKQGKQSLYGRNCAYRGENGLKCAVGVLIPDELYSVKFEGMKVCSPFLESLLVGYNIYLLVALQELHDCSSVEKWEAGFKRIAEQFYIIYSPPDATAELKYLHEDSLSTPITGAPVPQNTAV
jgi:hypothetical protein